MCPTDEIENFAARIGLLEEILAEAAAGQFRDIEVNHDDPLAAIELGVNTVLGDLRQRIDEAAQINSELDHKIAERTQELRERLGHITAQNEVIQRQRDAILELSTPVLQLWDDVIAMPIIGTVDAARTNAILERLLAAIAARRVRFAILDLTGAEAIDTASVSHFLDIVAAARMLGTECVLTGIQPEVALALASLGVGFEQVETRRDLQAGLRACLRAKATREQGAP